MSKLKKWVKKNGRKVVGGVITAAGAAVSVVTGWTGAGALAGGAAMGAGIKMMQGKKTKEVLGGAAMGAVSSGAAGVAAKNISQKLGGANVEKVVSVAKEIVPEGTKIKDQVGKFKLFSKVKGALMSDEGQSVLKSVGAAAAAGIMKAKTEGLIKSTGEESVAGALMEGAESQTKVNVSSGLMKSGIGWISGILLLLITGKMLLGKSDSNKNKKRR